MNEKPEKQPIRVLIVEDDRDFAFLIEKLLRRQEDIRIAGHCAEQAEVLEAVREAKPDVVLMDLNLGKSSADGIGLSREIRIQTDAKVPVSYTHLDVYKRQALFRYKEGVKPVLCGGNKMSSNGNGSLMRILPAAYYLYSRFGADLTKSRKAMDIVHKASALTHRHAIALSACGIYTNIAVRLMEGAVSYTHLDVYKRQDEAQAAVHAATLQCETYLQNQGYLEPGQTCTILLIDMGAGTTDLVLCRYTPGEKSENEILCTWPRKGDVLFGGQETDDLLRSFVQNRLPEKASLILKNFGNEKFKAWKENLVSPALLRGDEVDGFADLDSSLMMLGLDVGDYGLNRAVFERWAGEYLKGLPQLVRGCIQESGISPSEVELVVLTGGHSQWYFAKEILSGQKPEICETLLPQIAADAGRVISISRPQETVALGLAYLPLSVELPDLDAEFVFGEAGKGYTVIKYTGKAETVVIPAKYQGQPVTAIGAEAFAYRTELKRLLLPEGIERIEMGAFLGCSALESVELPQSCTYIENGAFILCDKIQSVKLPGRIQKLGAAAFPNEVMQTLEIPAGCELMSVNITSENKDNSEDSGASEMTKAAVVKEPGILDKVEDAMNKVNWGHVAYATMRILKILSGGG